MNEQIWGQVDVAHFLLKAIQLHRLAFDSLPIRVHSGGEFEAILPEFARLRRFGQIELVPISIRAQI